MGESQPRTQLFLSLHSARSVAAGELFHFGNADTVEVALDRVLESRVRYRKLDSRLRILARQEGVDQESRMNSAVTASRQSTQIAVLMAADFLLMVLVENKTDVRTSCPQIRKIR